MYKVLVAEDQQDTLELYRFAFPKYGILIVAAAMDGAEAVEMYKHHKNEIDAVIMDHRMPSLAGIEASEMILEFDPDAVIIFGSADVSVMEKAMAIGVKSFLKKPFDLLDLAANLKMHLNPNYPIESTTV